MQAAYGIGGSHAQKYYFCDCCHDNGLGHDRLGQVKCGHNPRRGHPAEGGVVALCRHVQLVPANPAHRLLIG